MRFLLLLVGLGGLFVVATTLRSRSQVTPSKPKANDDALRKKLSALQYEVTQRDATEPPFRNAYWDNHEAGLYVDIVSGEPLFASFDKFDSGTGWPSFSKPIDTNRVVTKRDVSHGMLRVEVRSKDADSHLGHLFDDGPAPSGQRYCINSASLRFVPLERLADEGYGEWLSRFSKAPPPPEAQQPNVCTTPAPGQAPGCETTFETVVLAGGCFWGMEDILRKIPGVVETEVGYAGGTTPAPTYETVKTGKTGHAESVRVVFDPKKLTLDTLLENWFFRMHDPTTANRQGNDVGSQYRSAIFVSNGKQKSSAEAAIRRVEASQRWKKPIVTQVVEGSTFTAAEGYHQDYLEKNPGGYTCHFLRD